MTDDRDAGAPGARLDPGSIETLLAELRGRLLLPGEPGYDSARTSWNAMIDRRPALIVRAAGVADVIAAVRFAAAHDLLLAVRGGGHNVAGNAVCEGGLMLDLSAMRGVRVDPAARTARAEGGATWGDLDAEAQAFGLATTGGVISSTGIAGLTLGGGIGWLMGSYGLACDNLLSLDLVTAAGELITAGADRHPELFWGLRGGGGNFGVVTSFEFRLHPVGPQLYGGLLLYPATGATAVLAGMRDFVAGAPDELGRLIGLVTAPDGTPAVMLVLVYNGPPDAGARVVEPLRALGPPLVDTRGVMSYRQVQTMLDAGSPPGRRNYWKSSFLDALPDGAIDALVACFRERPAPGAQIILECMGGAVARVGSDDTAFGHRTSAFNFLAAAGWTDPAGDEAHLAWVRATWRAMQPFAAEGVYVNYLGAEAEEGGARVRAAYGPGKYDRLVALKTGYDPHNLFRMNQNVRPARPAGSA
jgi:FAD/FMN-containing dehydrogenase